MLQFKFKICLSVVFHGKILMDHKVKQGVKTQMSDSQPSVDLFNLDYFRARLRSAKAAFPEPFILHAMALKANSIR